MCRGLVCRGIYFDDGCATAGVVGEGTPLWLCVDEPRLVFALVDSPLKCRRPCSIGHPFDVGRVVPSPGVVSGCYGGAECPGEFVEVDDCIPGLFVCLDVGGFARAGGAGNNGDVSHVCAWTVVSGFGSFVVA